MFSDTQNSGRLIVLRHPRDGYPVRIMVCLDDDAELVMVIDGGTEFDGFRIVERPAHVADLEQHLARQIAVYTRRGYRIFWGGLPTVGMIEPIDPLPLQ